LSARSLSYAVVTPARNEVSNLPRLAACLVEQTVQPSAWMVVDDASTDGTGELAARLAEAHRWVKVVTLSGEHTAIRGQPIVRAFTAGLEQVEPTTEVVVKLDADLSFEPDHFERLLAEFEADPRLGIAGGTCWEEERGTWRPQYTTRDHVRGAERAYRRECLEAVLPLEQRMGWDGVDELKAAVNGWRTASLRQLPIRHHRALGAREDRLGKWMRQGEMAHYMGYRPSYLVLRALYRSLRDPVALAMVWGFAGASVQRRARLQDPEVRALLRREQGLRHLGLRFREALGRD
jgi:biofilm PGA synthesis N-glycosyltransferase PgaC